MQRRPTAAPISSGTVRTAPHQGCTGPCGSAANSGTAGAGPACTANGLIVNAPTEKPGPASHDSPATAAFGRYPIDRTVSPRTVPASDPAIWTTSGADATRAISTVAKPAVSAIASPHNPASRPGRTHPGALRSAAGSNPQGLTRPRPAAAPATSAQPTAACAGSAVTVSGVATSARTAPMRPWVPAIVAATQPPSAGWLIPDRLATLAAPRATSAPSSSVGSSGRTPSGAPSMVRGTW